MSLALAPLDPALPACVQGVDHVQLPMPMGGAAQARDFYERMLGLREFRHPELDRPGTLRFALGLQRLDLTEGRYTGVSPQAHIALSVHRLGVLIKRLHGAGLRVDAAPLPSGQDRAYVEDPFGNRIEMIDAETHSIAFAGPHRATDLQFCI